MPSTARPPEAAPTARSRPNPGVGYFGPIPSRCWRLLHACWSSGLAVQSNRAREHAVHVALLASLGWISTVSPEGRSAGGVWRITREGLTAWEHQDSYPKEDPTCTSSTPSSTEAAPS